MAAVAIAVVPGAVLYASDGAGSPDAALESLTAIRAAAQSYVRAQLPAGASIANISAGALDSRLRLAHCASPLLASLAPGATLQARSTIGVHCAGPSVWTVYVPVLVESRIHVLVLRKPAAQDSRLSGADVAVEDRTVSVLGAAYLNDPEDLNGRTVRRALPAGTTLTVDMLRPDVLVHRGQEVTLIAAAGGLQVRASGRALADGEAGARLKVQNLTSQRVVEGVVESADVVRVQ